MFNKGDIYYEISIELLLYYKRLVNLIKDKEVIKHKKFLNSTNNIILFEGETYITPQEDLTFYLNNKLITALLIVGIGNIFDYW